MSQDFMLVIWDHKALADDELTISKGDIIKVLDKPDAGWWVGELNGVIGLFPIDYCKPYIENSKVLVENEIQVGENETENETESTPTPFVVHQKDVDDVLENLVLPNTNKSSLNDDNLNPGNDVISYDNRPMSMTNYEADLDIVNTTSTEYINVENELEEESETFSGVIETGVLSLEELGYPEDYNNDEIEPVKSNNAATESTEKERISFLMENELTPEVKMDLGLEPILPPEERMSLDITYKQFAEMYLGETEADDNELIYEMNSSQPTINLINIGLEDPQDFYVEEGINEYDGENILSENLFDIPSHSMNITVKERAPSLPKKSSRASSIVMDRRSMMDLNNQYNQTYSPNNSESQKALTLDLDSPEFVLNNHEIISPLNEITLNGQEEDMNDYFNYDQYNINSISNKEEWKHGTLSIKCEQCDSGLLSSTKHWKQYTVCLAEGALLIFKLREKSDQKIKFKGWYDLLGATINEASKAQSKKKHVFYITTLSGLTPLFLTEDGESYEIWMRAIKQHIEGYPLEYKRSEKVVNIIEMSRNNKFELDADILNEKNSQIISAKSLTGINRIGNKKEAKRLSSPGTAHLNSATIGESKELSLIVSSPPLTPTDGGKSKLRSKSKLMGKFFHKTSASTSSIPDKQTPLAPDSDSVWYTLQADSDYVAYVPKRCIEELKSRECLDLQGIYRLSGNAKKIKEWKQKFINIGPVSLASEDDINTITGILKLYFRELNEPLIPYDAYDAIIEACKISDYDERLLELKEILHTKLSNTSFSTLKALIFHLKEVSQLTEFNLMDANNLAIVFGPTIARPRDPNAHPQLQPLYMMVESLIVQNGWFFDTDEDYLDSYQESSLKSN